jgi:hypothetical protein
MYKRTIGYHKHTHGTPLLQGTYNTSAHRILNACEGDKDKALVLIDRLYPTLSWPKDWLHARQTVKAMDGKWYWIDVQVHEFETTTYRRTLWIYDCPQCNYRAWQVRDEGEVYYTSPEYHRHVGPYWVCPSCGKPQRLQWNEHHNHNHDAVFSSIMYDVDDELMVSDATWWLLDQYTDNVPYLVKVDHNHHAEDMWCIRERTDSTRGAIVKGLHTVMPTTGSIDCYVDAFGYFYAEVSDEDGDGSFTLIPAEYQGEGASTPNYVHWAMRKMADRWSDIIYGRCNGTHYDFTSDVDWVEVLEAETIGSVDVADEVAETLREGLQAWMSMVKHLMKTTPTVQWPTAEMWVLADTMLASVMEYFDAHNLT